MLTKSTYCRRPVRLSFCLTCSRTGIAAQDIGPNGPTYLTVWIALWIASGHVALPALVVAMLFAKNLKKRVLLINACVTWILASICYSLL